MERRAFLGTLTGGLLAAPFAAQAQQTKVYRVGFLFHGSPPPPGEFGSPLILTNVVLTNTLRELGYIEGRNIVIDRRCADSKMERFPILAAELVALKPDVLVATSTPGGLAAQRATATIPIVLAEVSDPVGTGLVASLARPGENVTGVTIMASGLSAKRLEMLKTAVPRLSRVLVLSYLVDPIAAPQVKELESAARSLGVKLLVQDVQSGDDLPAAFDAGARWHADGLLTTAESILVVQRKRIVELASHHRLPALYPYRSVVDSGGLMAYDSFTADLQARTATYVDRILKGENPSQLPVEQPTKVELVINLKTAKALGLTIPPSLLLRADQVIE